MKNAGQSYKFKGIVWWQGESDVDLTSTPVSQADYTFYAENFKTVLKSIRSVAQTSGLPNTTLPFVAVRVHRAPKLK